VRSLNEYCARSLHHLHMPPFLSLCRVSCQQLNHHSPGGQQQEEDSPHRHSMWRKKERTTAEKMEALARRGKDKLKKHFGQQSHDEDEDEVCLFFGEKVQKKKNPTKQAYLCIMTYAGLYESNSTAAAEFGYLVHMILRLSCPNALFFCQYAFIFSPEQCDRL
jgi:hypothetical protein